MMYTIGEFSKMTGLTVKTLRFYHEQGVLEPSRVEGGSGYRFYGPEKIETARVISALRELEFPIAEIREILGQCDDDAGLLSSLEARQIELQERMRNDRRIARQLQSLVTREREAQTRMSEATYQIEEKTLPDVQIAAYRMTGKYRDCGQGFGKLGRAFGRHINGKPMMLCHDGEYREDDANFEVAMPVRKGQSSGDMEVRTLPGGRCLSLLHKGPYEELPRAYEKIIAHAKQQSLTFTLPTREVYIKGPGMIFRGNPKKYLTEIQLMLEE